MRIARHTIWIDRPLGAGSRLRVDMEVMGSRQTYDLEILAFEPPSLWRHRTFESDFKGHVEYRFDTDGTGTRVTMTMVARPKTFYGWLALPVIAISRRKPYSAQLPQLKRVMEERLV